MTSEDFYQICVDVSRLAVRDKDRIGGLRLTQKTKGEESTIREPEMRHAFCRSLDDRQPPVSYDIEVPTEGAYRFVELEGDLMRKALHDLVLYEGEKRDVLVELKTGQPGGQESPAIRKDLQKFLCEKASGKVMFHVCHGSKSKTIPTLIGKYNKSFASALKTIEKQGAKPDDSGWIELYVLVLYDRNREWQPYLHRYRLTALGEGNT